MKPAEFKFPFKVPQDCLAIKDRTLNIELEITAWAVIIEAKPVITNIYALIPNEDIKYISDTRELNKEISIATMDYFKAKFFNARPLPMDDFEIAEMVALNQNLQSQNLN